MTKLILIGNCPSLGDGLIDTVNARDLHEAVGSRKDFSSWVKARILACGFVENQDFISLTQTGEREIGATTRIEYFLSLDMAKHFAMLERNDQGFKVRPSSSPSTGLYRDTTSITKPAA